MLRISRFPPVDYSLCNQIVTLYHVNRGETFTCTKTIFHGAYFDAKKVESVNKTGSREANSFLLVLPSGWGGRPVRAATPADEHPTFFLAPGDKVFLGEGPDIPDRETWSHFIPVTEPGLVVVKDVDIKYWHGAVCHIEAGG